MKLFIVAALVSVAAAARLEHLERSYLPPIQSHGQAGFEPQGQGFGAQGSFGSPSGAFSSGSGSFGSGSGSFGSGSGSFDSNVIDSADAGGRSQGFGSSSAFPGATSNQYLPPNHRPSGSNGQFSGSLSGFQRSQPFGGSQNTPNQYGSASGQNQYQGSASSLGQNQYQQQQYNRQFPATNRQYLAPERSSFQNIPQQPFDEQTGYHY